MKKYNKLISKIIFLIGISLLLYPIIGMIINGYLQIKSVDKYVETVNVVDKEKYQKLYDEAISYNKKVYLRQQENKRYNLDDEYEDVLKLDNTSIMGYIEIPKINIKLPIYHGVNDNTLQSGIGHVKESSLPIGTNNQNSMLMGHSGLPISKMFTNLEKLKKNDYIKITVLKKDLYYKIYKTEVIKPEELIDRLPIEEGKDLIKLVTCTPYGVNSHRLVIYAERVDKSSIDVNMKNKASFLAKFGIIILIILLLIILSISAYFIAKLLKNKRLNKLNKGNKKNKKSNSNKKKNSSKKKKSNTKKKKSNNKKKRVSKNVKKN